MHLNLLFVLSLILYTSTLRAENIVVTNTSDNGTGSLRWAIERANANGTAEADVILFNLPLFDFNDHIILLNTELPALTSNITIDGTTQPGQPFGLTDAKVAIKQDHYTPFFSMLTINNAKNVNIYGLYLYMGYRDGFFNPPARSNLLYGINIANSFDIQIGSPGKGNVINGAQYAIFSQSDSCRNINIKSNFIGQRAYFNVGSNPVTGADIDYPSVVGCEYAIFLRNVRDITIGGSNADEGNVFATNSSITVESNYTTENGFVIIRHNLFNKWYDRIVDTEYHPYGTSNIKIGNDNLSYTSDYELTFSDNWVNATIRISILNKPFLIERNRFIKPPQSQYDREKLTIYNCSGGGIIGGNNSADANYFTGKYDLGAPSLRLYNNGPITVLKNVFYCNYSIGSGTYIYNDNRALIPEAQVDHTTSTSVSGRATPYAKVDLYYDDECDACEGEIYIASVFADASGHWTYNGTIIKPVVAMPTSPAGYSGNFSQPRFDIKDIKFVRPTCGKSNGSITGITSEGAESYFWISTHGGDTVGRTLDLIDVPEGEYTLYGRQGTNCISAVGAFQLEDKTPRIVTAVTSIIHPSCGGFNGVISAVYFHREDFLVKWVDEQNNIIGNGFDLYDLGEGKYSLIVADTTISGGCSDTASFNLINISGPSLLTNNRVINPTTCSNNDGSITGITASGSTGQPFVEWINEAGQVVGHSFDLNNVPGGKYRLKFKDESNCDTIVTPYYIIPSTEVNTLSPMRVDIVDAYCSNNNGQITIHEFNSDPSPFHFKWIENNTNNVVGTTTSITGLAEGSYSLWVEDQNGCEAEIYSSAIVQHPNPKINISPAAIINDQCSLHKGGISGVNIEGAHGAISYYWEDEQGNKVGSAANLSNVASGKYKLFIRDEKFCESSTDYITINNENSNLTAPVYDNLVIPKNAIAELKVKHHAEGNYLLYSDALGQNLIMQNNSGHFKTPPLSDNTIYYVRFVSGSCSSNLTEVSITISDKSFFTIPSAFTPNNDGRNDYIEVRVHGYIQLEYFKIFNRYGQEVFVSQTLNSKWDGRIKGMEAPGGTYVWIAKGFDIYGKPVTGKGTIVLIR